MLSLAARRGFGRAVGVQQQHQFRAFSWGVVPATIPKNNAMKVTNFKVANLDASGLNHPSFGNGQRMIKPDSALGWGLLGLWITSLYYGFWCLKWHHPGNYFPPEWTNYERGWL
ncbi:unnamed protein product [Amoebophrya sp. A120]|nr:unnamed protein product [Amoebophrya sp. A120]|eukprot:GSA120T00016611001.1